MNYKAGDRVKIKSLGWYNKNKDQEGNVSCGEHTFVDAMAKFCGKELTIIHCCNSAYLMKEDMGGFLWTDKMIERYADIRKERDRCLTDFQYWFDNYCGLPDGYNVINATKIVLEKANTLKIPSDNMETKTHKGYCTTEVETTNESKKVAWLTFGDNDFADKVELDLSNRELIQEDGKWFVVKKKKEYPRTYEECAKVLLDRASVRNDFGYKGELLVALQKLLVCRDAYWKIYGEENGLGKPWEPDWNHNTTKYVIYPYQYLYSIDKENYRNTILAFPTAEMRDAFFENFKDLIEQCKELL